MMGKGMKTPSHSPPFYVDSRLTSNPFKHRGEVRQILVTSKDVMPAKAGYTSDSLHPLCNTLSPVLAYKFNKIYRLSDPLIKD
jgi:hypothetical protein